MDTTKSEVARFANVYTQELMFGLNDAVAKLPNKKVFFVLQDWREQGFLEDIGNGEKHFTPDYKEAIYIENFKNALELSEQYDCKLRKVILNDDDFVLSSWRQPYRKLNPQKPARQRMKSYKARDYMDTKNTSKFLKVSTATLCLYARYMETQGYTFRRVGNARRFSIYDREIIRKAIERSQKARESIKVSLSYFMAYYEYGEYEA